MKHYFDRLHDAMAECWDQPALCDYKGEEFKFSRLAEEIARFHILFEKSGIKKGDKIALCAKNCARWGVSFFAANTYEAVVVPILYDFHPDSINHLVDHSESRVLFIDDEVWGKLDIAKMPKVEYVISVNRFELLYSSDKKIEKLMADLPKLFAEKYPDGISVKDVNYPTGNDKDLAIINYTSGTTSEPKGVMLRYECLSSNVEFGQEHLPSYPGDKIVSMLPMAHMYGMMFEFIYPLCGGSSIYYLGKTPSPALLLGAMKDVHPYLVITVPLVMEKIFKNAVLPVVSKTSMKILLAIPGLKQVILGKIREKLLLALGGNVREIIMGGAALNPEVERWFKKLHLPFTVGYGMTEAAPLLAYSPWRSFVPKSCGRAVDREEVRIDSEDPQHVAGEIQTRGVNIMSGYYRNEAATQAAFTDDGWMNTGDLGVIDAHGNIFIRGRSKNMILSSNGQNIYPEEVEAVINNVPYVIETVVVDRESKLVALVYLDSDKIAADGASQEEICRNIIASNRSLPSYSKIAKVEIVDKPFEKTPKMSIKRFLYK